MIFGPFNQQVLCFSSPSEPVPSREDHERDDVRQYELQQDDAVIPIAPPKLRFLLDAPQPLQAPFPHAQRCSLDRAGLKINSCAEMNSDRNAQAISVLQQPSLAFFCP